MSEPRNRVVQLRRFGDPDGLELVDAPLPTAGRGEVRIRVLASSEGKLVLCPDLPAQRDRMPPKREPGAPAVQAPPAG